MGNKALTSRDELLRLLEYLRGWNKFTATLVVQELRDFSFLLKFQALREVFMEMINCLHQEYF